MPPRTTPSSSIQDKPTQRLTRARTRIVEPPIKPSTKKTDTSNGRNQIPGLDSVSVPPSHPTESLPSKPNNFLPKAPTKKASSESTIKRTSKISKKPADLNGIASLTQGIQQIDVNEQTQPKSTTVRKTSKPPLNSTSTSLLPSNTSSLSNIEQGKLAMKAVNLHLTTLAEIYQSGWKADEGHNYNASDDHGKEGTRRTKSSSSNTYDISQVLQIVDDCASALYALRKFIVNGSLPNSKLFDVERAGLTLVHHSLELHLYNSALRLLDVAHTYLQSLVSSNATSTLLAIRPKPTTATPISFDSWQDFSQVLRFDLSELEQDLDAASENISLLATAVAQGFQAFLNASSGPPKSLLRQTSKTSQTSLFSQSTEIRGKCCIKALTSATSLDRWHKLGITSGHTCSVKILAAAQASYTAVVKACAAWEDSYLRFKLTNVTATIEPELLFQLRKSAIISLLGSQVQFGQASAVDLLMDQARRTLIIYARSRPDNLKDVALHAKHYITEIIQTARSYLQNNPSAESGWIGLCQAVTTLARKAGDLELIEHVTPFLKVDHDSFRDAQPTQGNPTAEKQINLLLLKLATATVALDRFNKSGEAHDTCSQLENSILSLSVVYCHHSTVSEALRQKVDSSVERLRRLCLRTIRHVANSEERQQRDLHDSLKAVCCSVLTAIVDTWDEEIKKSSTRISIDKGRESCVYSMMVSGSIESLICLAEHLFCLTIPQTHRESLDRLERCKSLIKALPAPEVSIIRCITSVYYNAGVSLYHADKPLAAIAFVKHACQYPDEMFNITRNSDGRAYWHDFEDVNDELDALRGQLIKRWELLALCYLSTDKALAHSAYISAIRSHGRNAFSQLGLICGKNADVRTMIVSEPGLCKLIQRATRLATWDLLLPDHESSLLRHISEMKLPPEATGAVMEVQLNFLYCNGRKAECRPTIRAILSDCLTVYDPKRYPLRRARTLCRLMEWMVGGSLDLSEGDALGKLFEEIESLCGSHDHANDIDLAQYLHQYIAFGHIWIALAAQQACETVKFLNASKFALTELQVITQALLPTHADSQDESQKQPSSPPSRKTTLTRVRTLGPQLDKLSNPFATPAAKPRNKTTKTINNHASSSNFDVSSTGNVDVEQNFIPIELPLDDMERYLQHLRLFSHVLAVHGLIHSKLTVLQLLRLVYERWLTRSPKDETAVDGIATVMIEMVLSFMQLEDTQRAGTLLNDQAINYASNASVPISRTSETALMLLRSRNLSNTEKREEAASAFASAHSVWALAESEDDESAGVKSQISSTNRVIKRTNSLYMSALASSTYSYIEENNGHLNSAIDSILRSIRLLHRAASNILRISRPPLQTTKTVTNASIDDVFGSTSEVKDCIPLPEVPRETRPRMMTVESHPVGELTWQIASAIAEALKRVSMLYLTKGSPRMAEGYLSQLTQFATKTGSTRLEVSGMTYQAEMMILKGEYDTARVTLNDALTLLSDEPSAELAEIWRLRGSLSYRTKMYDEAREHCSLTCEVLRQIGRESLLPDQLTNITKSLQSMSLTTRLPTRTMSYLTCILSTTAARAVYIQARVSRDLRRVEELAQDLLILSKLPPKAKEKVFETTLVALAELDDVLQTYRVDPLLGVLPEAMIAIPPRSRPVAKTQVKKDDIPRISQAITTIEETLSRRTIECAEVWNLQETVSTLMTLKFIGCILGRAAVNAAGEVAALMDFASSITIRREMLDVVRSKLDVSNPPDDLSWPLSSPSSSRFNSIQDTPGLSSTRLHWLQVQRHHLDDLNHPGVYRPIRNLPKDWRIVSLHLSQDRDSLFLVQHHNLTDPLVLKLPMSRQSRREGEDDQFTLSVALQELQSIVSCSNAATQRAKHVTGHAEKLSWWKERKELDTRMRRLVESIENHWLGGCKGFLRCSNRVIDREELRNGLEKVFREHLICSQDRTIRSGKLDDHVIDAFISLPINCRDEDLEDLIQFAVDCYQIKEAPVVGDEVDADQVVCQLREIQKEMLEPYSKEANSKQHLFLILDKNLQGFPWEVLPHLRGYSISRIPCLSFLRDRLSYSDETSSSPDSNSIPSDTTIDPSRTTYILNPSDDLNDTQNQFESWLEGYSSWNGIKKRSPTSEEFKQALVSSNLMLYFGHGGGEQYIRSITIKQLPRCAVTMLWGCSSGMLQDQGEFDPTGTPYAYMLAGCPALVANLWDVTDKDIDRLAIDLFKRTGLHPSDEPNREPVSITQALAESRSICQLRYLNGAAPVVYGMPVRFRPVDQVSRSTK